MSLHSTSRTSLFRRGLVAVATATTLLAGGLVVAPAAQASSPPVVTGAISTQETDGRPARITAVVRELRISGDGALSSRVLEGRLRRELPHRPSDGWIQQGEHPGCGC